MTTETSPNLTDLSIAELEARALHSTNRFMSLACSRLAEAKKALALGDVETARKYQEAARTAFKRSQEDEHGILSRVRATAAAIAADGVQTSNVEVSGLATHYTSEQTHRSTGAARRLVGVRL